MSRAIPIKTVVEATIEGIKDAFKQYYDHSGECWLDHAPEYFVTSSIFRSLSKIKASKFLTLEYNVRETLDNAGAITCGRLHNKLRSNGRSDILLWHANDTPRAIIEVKSPLYQFNDKAMQDIHRIEKALLKNKSNNSLQFGIFAFYTSAASNSKQGSVILGDKEAGRIKLFIKKASEEAERCMIESYFFKKDNKDEGAWVAGCLLIKPK